MIYLLAILVSVWLWKVILAMMPLPTAFLLMAILLLWLLVPSHVKQPEKSNKVAEISCKVQSEIPN